MTDERDDRDEREEGAGEEESPELARLLKRSLAADEPASTNEDEADRHLLENVQRKLRQRSKGKFYADGWSTTRSRANYAVIAAIMLVTILVVYLALGPMAVTR